MKITLLAFTLEYATFASAFQHWVPGNLSTGDDLTFSYQQIGLGTLKLEHIISLPNQCLITDHQH